MSETFSDRIAANIREAIAYRFLHNYLHAREQAERQGADVSALPDASFAAIDQRYHRIIEEWLPETPNSAMAARAFVDFATVTMLDATIGGVLDCGTISGDVVDRDHAVRALMAAADWLGNAENAEVVAKMRETVIEQPDGSAGTYTRRPGT